MVGRQRLIILLVVGLVLAALLVINRIPVRLGLDLQGGAQLTLQVKTTTEVKEITPPVLEAVQRVVEGRINGLGVSEAVVQTVGSNQLLVQLPGVNDPQQAERVLGGTAQLDFRRQRQGTDSQQIQQLYLVREQILAIRQQENSGADPEQLQKDLKQADAALAAFYEPTGLTGKNLQDAVAQPLPAGNQWQVAIRFDGAGGQKFAELTQSIAGTGRTLGIFLDDTLISFPSVSAEFAAAGITGGAAVITGSFTAESANDLAVQLRGGALPVPVEIVENRTVGATLGQDSIQSSYWAFVGGMGFVLVFMVFYYRLPGLIADFSLLIYALLTYASFVLLGVTLTLPGIAGFILSIGMAVDANILIFERTREELQVGKSLYRSVESGFYRAFSSILDGNVTTLIACAALFWLGTGLVKGFALTLGLGVLVSMFTALTCSRTFLLFALTIPSLRRVEFYAPKSALAKG
ncbi:preprotein translocase subunit SecD [Gloeomargarita lithophora Alchichica-D10]|uniref:Protein translocase subunit SecD n=1 Tax=Gloeomargarita lithophora Alchichica-D10 TaxID=1188229 RepID=A0A1J0AEU7_9CYAN|nr:protein translocase subunit SecD [Gloeomargarita lithophora]APB34440.1 preprotein translocase subunit SecD [Gloeomargarita lithophora Alchichica-D10]